MMPAADGGVNPDAGQLVRERVDACLDEVVGVLEQLFGNQPARLVGFDFGNPLDGPHIPLENGVVFHMGQPDLAVARAHRSSVVDQAAVAGNVIGAPHSDGPLPYVEHFANLIVCEALLDDDDAVPDLAEVERLLQPDGGVALIGRTFAVVQALDDLNANNDVAACNALQAFIDAVAAQSGNQIPEVDANALIVAAQAIILALGCS